MSRPVEALPDPDDLKADVDEVASALSSALSDAAEDPFDPDGVGELQRAYDAADLLYDRLAGLLVDHDHLESLDFQAMSREAGELFRQAIAAGRYEYPLTPEFKAKLDSARRYQAVKEQFHALTGVIGPAYALLSLKDVATGGHVRLWRSPTRSGGALKAMRAAAKMTQAALADRLQISQTHVSQIESGVRTPSVETIEQWAEACEFQFEFGFFSRVRLESGVEYLLELAADLDFKLSLAGKRIGLEAAIRAALESSGDLDLR